MTEHALIQTLRRNLADSPPPESGADAAVLITILADGPEPEVLLTRRPTHMKSHAGEVAFPGGKRDADDSSLTVTALREAEEEVGLARDQVEILGALRHSRAKSGIKVVPVVGLVRATPVLTPNPDEVESVFRVPLRFFLETQPARDYRVTWRSLDLVVPCFRYDGYIIWGLTAHMLVEFARHGFGHVIDYPWPPVLPGILAPETR